MLGDLPSAAPVDQHPLPWVQPVQQGGAGPLEDHEPQGDLHQATQARGRVTRHEPGRHQGEVSLIPISSMNQLV